MKNNITLKALFILFILFILFRLIQIYPTYFTKNKTNASMSQGIDFRLKKLPYFIENIEGFSWAEPWGTWTDKTIAPTTTIKFRASLPRKFKLEIVALGFGPNSQHPTKIILKDSKNDGNAITKELQLNSTMNTYSLNYQISNIRNANVLEIIPPKPITPKSLSINSDDTREIGVGIKSIRIIAEK